jgi:hypothetical protein
LLLQPLIAASDGCTAALAAAHYDENKNYATLHPSLVALTASAYMIQNMDSFNDIISIN